MGEGRRGCNGPHEVLKKNTMTLKQKGKRGPKKRRTKVDSGVKNGTVQGVTVDGAKVNQRKSRIKKGPPPSQSHRSERPCAVACLSCAPLCFASSNTRNS